MASSVIAYFGHICWCSVEPVPAVQDDCDVMQVKYYTPCCQILCCPSYPLSDKTTQFCRQNGKNPVQLFVFLPLYFCCTGKSRVSQLFGNKTITELSISHGTHFTTFWWTKSYVFIPLALTPQCQIVAIQLWRVTRSDLFTVFLIFNSGWRTLTSPKKLK